MTRTILSLFISLTLLTGLTGYIPASARQSGMIFQGEVPIVEGMTPLVSPDEQLSERYQGAFALPNTPLDFWIKEIFYSFQGGIYNITTTSSWPVFIYSASGALLSDTNGDGIVDTGEVPIGIELDIRVRVIPPTILNPGDMNNFNVVLISTENPGIQLTTSIQVATPESFAQIFIDDSLGNKDAGISIYRNGKFRSVYQKSVPFEIVLSNDNSIVEAPTGGFIYTSGMFYQFGGGDVIDVGMLDYEGLPVWPVFTLDDHSNATMDTHDQIPTVAVAPDGSVGIAWRRYLYDTSGILGENTNVYLAILSPSGQLRTGLINVTNNQVWGGPNDPNYPVYSAPVIAATSDNRFLLAWQHSVTPPSWVDNIEYAIYSSNGALVKAPTNLTNAQVNSGDLFTAPSVSGISNQRFLVTYLKGNPLSLNLWYLVLDSSGNVVFNVKKITDDDTSTSAWIRADSAELRDGRVIVAWNATQELRFVVLDTSYNKVAGPVSVSHPAMDWYYYSSFVNLSLSAGPGGKAILTWGDPERQNLYYAAINPDGSFQTPPMIMQASEGYLIYGSVGYNNTSYSISPSSSNVDTYIRAPLTNPVMPNKVGDIPIQLGNLGATTASGVVVTATLSSGLSYVGDSSSVTPTLQTDELTWSFPGSLGFLGAGKFDLRLSASQAEIGSSLPLTLTIHTAQPDGDLSNNTFVTQVVVPTTPYMYFPIVGH